MWTQIKLNLDHNKGALLSAIVLNEAGLNPGDEYVLVNNHSGVGVIDIKPQTDLPIIRMRPIAGYTVIDWHTLIANARQNHHVSTSTFHLFQAIKNSFGTIAPEHHLRNSLNVYLYPRPNDDGFRGISQLDPTFNFTPVI